MLISVVDDDGQEIIIIIIIIVSLYIIIMSFLSYQQVVVPVRLVNICVEMASVSMDLASVMAYKTVLIILMKTGVLPVPVSICFACHPPGHIYQSWILSIWNLFTIYDFVGSFLPAFGRTE